MMKRALLLLAALSGPVAAQPLLVQAEGQIIRPLCTGRDVRIEGNHNVIKPFGVCGSLLLKGVANQVTLDLAPASTIRVEGSANEVTYRARAIAVTETLGEDNVVTSQLVPAAEAGSNLRLFGDDQAKAADCTAQNVIIQGSRGLFVLRGGCRSLTIHGDLVAVQAEMLPGAPIAITGHGSRVGWVLDGHGHAPLTTLHGDANQVEHLDAIGGVKPH